MAQPRAMHAAISRPPPLLHERLKGTNTPIFQEFDGLITEVIALDSEGDPTIAVGHAIRLISQDGVQWIVSGDVYPHVSDATRIAAEDSHVDCILACNRMELPKPNPHPSTFQVPLDHAAWSAQLIQLLPQTGAAPGNHVLLLGREDAEPFARQRLEAPLEAAGHLLLYAARELSPDDLKALVSRAKGEEPAAVIVLTGGSEAAARAAEAFPDAPRLLDAPHEDPADLAETFADQSGETYVVALASRAAPRSEAQRLFAELIREIYGYEPDAISFYGGVTGQVIGRAVATGNILEVEIPAEESVGGFAVRFDERGANAAATLSLFRLSDGTVEFVEPAQ